MSMDNPITEDNGGDFADFADFGNEAVNENPFPTQSFPGRIQNVITQAAKVASVPESIIGMSVLGTTSAALGAGLKVRNYAGELRGNLFGLVVARSGTGKDRAFSEILKPLTDIDRQQLDEWQMDTLPRLEGRQERIKNQLRELSREKPSDERSDSLIQEEMAKLTIENKQIERELDQVPAIMVGDATKEALALAMSRQPGEAIAMISSEARGQVSVLKGRYQNGSTDEDIYTGGFSGSPCKVIRARNNGRHIIALKRPCLSVLWMVQPDTLHSLMQDPAMVESGFLPRFIFFDAKAEPQPVPDEIPTYSPGIMEYWERLVVDLLWYRDEGGMEESDHIVKPSEDAMEKLREFDNSIRDRRRSGNDLHDVEAYAARWPEITWRVALNLHAMAHGSDSHKNLLGVDIAQNAIELMEWVMEEELNLLYGQREAKNAQRASRFEAILRERKTISLRDLQRRYNYPTSEVRSLEGKLSFFKIEQKKSPDGKAGRPSLVATLICEEYSHT